MTRGYEALATVTCEALSLFAVNSASHRSLQAAGTFQTTLSLLGSSPECHISMETEAMVSTPLCPCHGMLMICPFCHKNLIMLSWCLRSQEQDTSILIS